MRALLIRELLRLQAAPQPAAGAERPPRALPRETETKS
jgi:hypothetical protein